VSTQKYFEENGYVVLSEVIPKQECFELAQHMFNLFEQGKLVRDDQCPLSDAVYGDPKFDALLARLAEPLGRNIGKKLLPTYTYARIYRPGEILKKHKDRPSCELSATLTLAYDAKSSWPIFFANGNKELPIQLEAGEMAVYRGCDLVHWRPPFKGNWHVQVFLHYVDAEGPYADHAYDKRGALSGHPGTNTTEQKPVKMQLTKGEPLVQQQQTVIPVNVPRPVHNATIVPSVDNTFPGYITYNSQHRPELAFTPEECDRIIEVASHTYPSTASVGGGNDGTVAREIRSADIYNVENVPELRWIFEKIAAAVYVANKEHFDFDAETMQHGLQLIHYKADSEVPGHYNWHTDAGRGVVATRKISFVAQLSEPDKYEGCDLEVYDHNGIILATKERGSMHMFPSYMLHRVRPIQKGERWSLVIWVHGSRRFR
jgi:PKHD-type hydroxylase